MKVERGATMRIQTCFLNRGYPSLLVYISFILLLAVPPAGFGRELDSSSKSFVDSIAETVYGFAWPTAKYERVSFGEISREGDSTLISFRLHGKSGFNDGPLWVDVVIELRNGEIEDLRWGRHNALLAPPGATMKALGEFLAELNKEHPQGQGGGGQRSVSTPSPPSREGYRFVFTNGCGHPLQLAIRFLGTDGQWHTEGWWTFPAWRTSSLTSCNFTMLSNHSEWYFFAESTDGSHLEWSGNDLVASFDGRQLRMLKRIDASGDSEWTATCP